MPENLLKHFLKAFSGGIKEKVLLDFSHFLLSIPDFFLT